MSIQRFNVWPYTLQAKTGKLTGIGVPFIPPAQIQYQSFAIGFFGFHHIRAINENETVLQRESWRILNKLATASRIDPSLFPALKNPKKQGYSDFWENVLSKIAFTLGDAGGHRIQKTVEFGFWLAAAYACMVGVLQDAVAGQVKTNLSILEDWISNLLIFARQAEISDASLDQLTKSKGILRSVKTYSSAHKCLKNMELLIKENILPRARNSSFKHNN